MWVERLAEGCEWLWVSARLHNTGFGVRHRRFERRPRASSRCIWEQFLATSRAAQDGGLEPVSAAPRSRIGSVYRALDGIGCRKTLVLAPSLLHFNCYVHLCVRCRFSFFSPVRVVLRVWRYVRPLSAQRLRMGWVDNSLSAHRVLVCIRHSGGRGLENALAEPSGLRVVSLTVCRWLFVLPTSALPSWLDASALVGCVRMLVSVCAFGCERD